MIARPFSIALKMKESQQQREIGKGIKGTIYAGLVSCLEVAGARRKHPRDKRAHVGEFEGEGQRNGFDGWEP